MNDLHAFYEYTQKYNIRFEYIGINGKNDTNVAIKIIENPNISKIEITSDFFKYEDAYIQFDWIKYIEMNIDIKHIKCKEEAWDHWILHGKNEGRQYFVKKIPIIISDPITEDEKNKFDWIKYIELNSDLKHINNKETAWDHWIHHGKHEGRQTSVKENEDKNMFDWKKYTTKNNDLQNIKSKEEAWEHWIHHGKHEGRKFFFKKICDDKKNFDWKSYIENNNDLIHINTEQDAWYHWIHYGKNEGRTILDNNFIKFSNFDWRYYIENNKDLNHIHTKDGAWEHWFYHGKYENRLFKKKIKKIEFIF
jgi:hypothetical protein